MKRDGEIDDVCDEGVVRMDLVMLVFGNWFLSVWDDGSESDDGSDVVVWEVGLEKSDDARDEDGATRADEDAEARVLLLLVMMLYLYEDVR